MKNVFQFTVAIISLVACANSTPTIAPSENITAVVPSGTTVSHDTALNQLTVTNGGVPQTLPINVAIPGSFEVYHGASIAAIYAKTASGSGQVTVLFDNSVPMRGTITHRLSNTRMPTGGTAAFTGEYTGFILEDVAGTWVIDDVIQGTATLDADFAANTIQGAITSRNLPLSGAAPFNTLNLGQTSIDSSASFSGTATGGEFIGPPATTTSNGAYSGQIVGANGTEIVGGVTLNHTDGLVDRLEIGGFFGGN